MIAIWPVQSSVFAAPPGLLSPSPSLTIVHNYPTQTLFGGFLGPCLLQYVKKKIEQAQPPHIIVHDGIMVVRSDIVCIIRRHMHVTALPENVKMFARADKVIKSSKHYQHDHFTKVIPFHSGIKDCGPDEMF